MTVRNTAPLVCGFDGRFEPRPATVPSPYQAGEVDHVVRNVRESGLDRLAARGKIGRAQERAGNRFRALHELYGMQNGAVDMSREPVDVCGIAEPIPVRVIDAGKQLARIAKRLGPERYRLVSAICGEGKSVAEFLGVEQPKRKARQEVVDKLKQSLNILARLWGYA